MKVDYVGIITKRDAPDVRQVGTELAGWLEQQGIRAALDRIDPAMDMLVILGGDGTLLHVAAQASHLDIPVVGINLGNLGFLTEVAAGEMYQALETILAGQARIEKRMMLRASLFSGRDGQESEPLFALNEVVIVKESTDRIMRLSSWADEEFITTYKGDGLIISTPTGSTAYNLSAGGPIVHAELGTILVTPICPFMLESRPVLLSPDVRITTRLADPENDVKVIVDGRPGWDMKAEDCLVVQAAAKPLRLISSPHKGYFAILRNKLNWGGRDEGFALPDMVRKNRRDSGE
ncbi:NAD(+)/NADH kinase [Desulfolithobacter sp.]